MRLQLAFHRLTGTVHPVTRLNSPSRADLVMRGFAISFLTLARVASRVSFLAFFFIEHP
jgi:hypothetical protein